MSKHTPGPWQTDIDGQTAYVVDADGNMAVCKIMYARPEGPANARLIAQAPRLLEALEAFVNYDAEKEGDVSMIDCERLWNQARAAIEATKGNDNG